MPKKPLHKASTSPQNGVWDLHVPLRYTPPRPKVRWVRHRLEVPQWDWTRGFGPATVLLRPERWSPEVARSHGVRPTPEGLSFPRLVRAEPHRAEYSPVDESVIEVLSRELWPQLAKLKTDGLNDTNTAFAAAIPRVVQRVGLLDPFGEQGYCDTLANWARATIVARFWSRPHDLGLEGWKRWHNPIPPALRDLDWSSPANWPEAGAWYLHKGLEAGHLKTDPFGKTDGLEYRGGVLGWLNFEIAHLLLQPVNVDWCEECGAPLPEGRRLYCSERCARRVHMRRYRARKRDPNLDPNLDPN